MGWLSSLFGPKKPDPKKMTAVQFRRMQLKESIAKANKIPKIKIAVSPRQ